MNKYENYKHDLNTIEVTMISQCNKEYEDIKNNFDTIKELVEKEKPKKVLEEKNIGDMYIGKCPKCKSKIFEDETYCSDCGQLLEWNCSYE